MQTCLRRLQKFGIKPDGIINFLAERASSMRQRLQDTAPFGVRKLVCALAAGRLIKL
jgi:hypothetical protein